MCGSSFNNSIVGN